MADVAAIKVKIGLRPNSHADHPDWTTLSLAGGDELVVKQHQFGGGWKYDKTSGHAEDTADSPIGQQWGMMLVSEQFAIEALAKFPALVTRMTEAETQTFWDDKAHAHLTDERRDVNELTALRAEFQLVKDLAAEFPGNTKLQNRLVTLKTQVQKALDPDDNTPGVKKNIQRRWVDAKAAAGLTFVEP